MTSSDPEGIRSSPQRSSRGRARATASRCELASFLSEPTPAGLAKAIEAAQARTDGPGAPPLPASNGAGPAGSRCSLAQERFWFIDQATGSHPVSHVPWAVRLRGPVDADALQRALDEVARRHEILRTRFALQSGQPTQLISSAARIPFATTDVSAAPDPEAEMRRLVDELTIEPFDLATGPLLRAQLIVLGDDDHVLQFVAHHIICDDWSKGVIMRELGAAYEAVVSGADLDLPAAAIQYREFAEWQRERLDEQVIARELDQVKQVLDGAPAALELPTDRPRPPAPSLEGKRLRSTVPPELAAELRGLGRAEGATLFMTMLAAFDVLLERYTGQQDLVVGTAIDNRGRVELEGTVGLLTNVLALRTDLSGAPSFRELLARVRATTLGAITHQELPFDRLAATVDRDPSRHPIFQVFYEFIVPAPVELPLPGVRVEPLDISRHGAEFDFALYMDEQHGGLDAVWEYSTDLFDADTVARIARHFVVLLRAIAADPDRPIDQLTLLDDGERNQVVAQWNATATETAGKPVHELFEAHAQRTPAAPALLAAGAGLSYEQLNARANQLAHLLAQRGVETGDAVGLCMERSADLVVGLLGILKAGAAYVPLNPDHPAARLQQQLSQAGARVLVTDAATRAALPSFAGEVVCVEEERDKLAALPSTDPQTPIEAGDPAYILYTSGSTGVPKGVAVSHRNLANYTSHVVSVLGLEQGLQFASVSAVSTDLGNTTIFGSLAGGGCLHLIETETATDAAAFADYVREHPIDVLKITPSHLAALLDGAGEAAVLPRRFLFIGGELLTWGLAEKVALPGGPRVINHYGPTEATIGCCTFELHPAAARPPSASVPIGRPISNARVYLLDRLGAPVPVGVPGELHVGGDGVALGYIGAPEQTAQVFVGDPFTSDPHARLYRTGDLARYLPDGDIEFLGRADAQVKIRGFRVEPGEVEASLVRLDGVSQAAVLTRGEGEARHLVAFVVAGADPEALLTKLAETLPAYMIPSSIVALDALPLTANGKLDRAALRDAERAPESPSPADTGALSDAEATLVPIWEELLGHPIGVEENFFEVGGHSLLAIRLIARLRTEVGVKLTLKALVDAPTVRQLAAKVDAAGGAKAGAVTPAPESAPAIAPVPRDRPLRSGFAQEQFWLVDQLTPGSTAYNFSWPMRLRGPLDVAALQRAVAEVVRRHEALRTHFAAADGEPVQIIDPPGGIGLDLVDLSSQRQPEQAALRRVEQQTQTPFDLERGPLLRMQLLRLADDDHVLSIVVHHIVFDGVSKVVLYRELGALYAAFAAAGDSPLPEPPIHYGDFAEWQRRQLDADRLGQELEFWRKELAGIPAALELPTDRPRPQVASLRGARHREAIPRELRTSLDAVARENGATFFMAMLAAFDVLLYRYSGQEDIVVGAPVDTRSRPELENVLGPFLNTIVLRTDMSGSPSFRELLGRVRGRTLDALSHQDLPFEQLVEALAPRRDLSRHPVFQALLALNPPEKALELPGISVHEIDPEWSASRVDLFLVLDDLPHGLDAVWEYSTDLFEPASIERLGRHFLRLLSEIVANPDCPVDELPWLEEAERAELLEGFNQTEAQVPDGRLDELIALQAARSPGRVAVQFEDSTLTYAELDERADRLASRLRSLGVQTGQLVGVCLQRSEQLLVALLGVLKAGGAYVPIDPAFPAERQQFMLDDADVAVLITQTSLVESLPSHRAAVIRIDDQLADDHVTGQSAGDADDLAYVIYTSGSTGRPKGVEIQHRALVNFLHSMRERPGLTGDDVLVAVTTLSFDIAGLELYLPLICGARVVIAPQETASDPRKLWALLERSGATVMQATPTTWRMLIDAGWPGKPGFKALCGGEALPLALADELVGRELELWNMYGPTETTIWSTVQRVSTQGEPLSIGRPIANTTLFILDGRGQPTPIGVPGELHIGGAGVARGYRERPELTAERFASHPFDPSAGSRLYKTGDLARYRADGSVQYLGRLDNQVKVRGFRIELGEIETQLAAHPAVAAAVASTHEQRSGESELVAYIVPSGQAPAGTELRRFLEQKLPAYMVPSTFVTLDAFPLTPNAKVDRKALPRPEAWGTEPVTEYVAPGTELERRLTELWGELLQRDRIGLQDNFFDLGGHSLLAARLIGRIHSELEVRLPLRALFEAPTIGGLAERIESMQVEETGEEPPPLVPVARVRRASFAQERFWFIDQLTGGSAAYNIPWPLRLKGELDVVALGRALTEIVRRHEPLRTRFSIEDGRPVQLVDAPQSVSLEPTDLSREPDPERAASELVDRQTQLPFDLERGPLLRATLLRLSDRDHVLSIVVHHIAADGWSKTVFLRELDALYRALCDGLPSPLPELPVQYGDYAEWERSWLSGDKLAAELEHWRVELDGAPAALELPTDRPRPAVPTLAGAWRRTAVQRELADALRALGRRERATSFMTVLAALDVFLHRYTGQDEIVVGTPVDTRGRPELEGAIGAFVNTVVIRGDLSGRPSFTEVLGRVRKRTLDALAHQYVPFERVVDTVVHDRDLSRHPLCQVLLAVPAPEPAPRLAALEVSEIETQKTTARVDLTVLVNENDAGMEIVWEYSTDLFDAQTIDRMAAEFVCLLRSIVSSPDRPVGELALIDDSARGELLAAWGTPREGYPVACIDALFEAQCELTPDAIAVRYEGQELSYRELNERANQLARRLRALGVGPDGLVALCLERSLEMVVSILAVLKAGGAYVPLDPSYPAERLEFMLADCSAAVLITEQRLGERLGEHAATVLNLDSEREQLEAQSPVNLDRVARPENLAYVIYTSGSTGQPKGVLVEHRNVARLFSATDAWFHPGAADTWTLFHSYAFDFSVWELWGALLHGGTLIIVPQFATRSPAALAELLVAERVTVLNATPSLFAAAIDELMARSGDLSLRLVVFGGEALAPRMLRGWFECFGDERPQLVNMYGITETTVHVTYRPLVADDAEQDRSPIGGPIPDLQLYLLDDALQPVAPGIAGELYVGGEGVARGYLNRPELTAERFIPNPFGEGRLYRTGDRARFGAEHGFRFEGRIDDQVKVRGFRIELGEIQAALIDSGKLAEAVVLAFAGPQGDTRLAAYVVPKTAPDDDGAALRAELRADLKARLPEYMVPWSFNVLDQLPLTANGKLDRKALPVPASDRQSEDAAAPPSTATEQALLDMWSELLGAQQIGIHDDFFALGGHSLLVAELVARVRERFGTPVSIRTVFSDPTIKALADSVDALRNGHAGRPEAEAVIPPRAPGEPHPLSYTQEQLWLIDQWDPGAPTYNVALPFRIRGALRLDALRAALDRLVQRHEVLRTVLRVQGDMPVPVLLEGPAVEFDVIDLESLETGEREAELNRILSELARRPFDFSQDVLLRAAAIRLAEDDHVLLLQTHHIVFDGGSETLLLEELAAIYEGREPPVPPLQYGDFATWQRERLSGEVLEEHLEFWRRHLAGAPTSINLPFDRERPTSQRFEGATHEISLPSDVADAVRACAGAERATPYIVLLAALATLLYRTTGQDDILIGSPFAHRPSPELDRVIGFFSNTLVFRARLAGNPTFRELVGRVREMALGVYAHEDIPFEMLVQAIRPQRTPGVNPLFQVNLRVSTSKRGVLALRGLEITPLGVDIGFTRFDLALDAQVLDDGIEGYFRYNREMFEPATIAKLADDFTELLREVLARPDEHLLAFEVVGVEQPAAVSAGGIRGFRKGMRT